MLLNCGAGEDSLRVPWTMRSNQSIPKEINPEGLMLKLKFQYFGHLMQRVNSLEKTPRLGNIEGSRRGGGRGWDGWMASMTQWTWVEQALGDSEGQGSLACWSLWGCKESDTTELLNNNSSLRNWLLHKMARWAAAGEEAWISALQCFCLSCYFHHVTMTRNPSRGNGDVQWTRIRRELDTGEY